MVKMWLVITINSKVHMAIFKTNSSIHFFSQENVEKYWHYHEWTPPQVLWSIRTKPIPLIGWALEKFWKGQDRPIGDIFTLENVGDAELEPVYAERSGFLPRSSFFSIERSLQKRRKKTGFGINFHYKFVNTVKIRFQLKVTIIKAHGTNYCGGYTCSRRCLTS